MGEVGTVNSEVDTAPEVAAETIQESGAVYDNRFFEQMFESSEKEEGASKSEVGVDKTPEEAEVDETETDNSETNVEKPLTAEEIRQLNIDKLEEFYGDQLFQFKTHVGTITDIINVCPALKYFVNSVNGFEKMVSFVDKYKVDSIEEPEPDDDAEDESSKGEGDEDGEDGEEKNAKKNSDSKDKAEPKLKDEPTKSISSIKSDGAEKAEAGTSVVAIKVASESTKGHEVKATVEVTESVAEAADSTPSIDRPVVESVVISAEPAFEVSTAAIEQEQAVDVTEAVDVAAMPVVEVIEEKIPTPSIEVPIVETEVSRPSLFEEVIEHQKEITDDQELELPVVVPAIVTAAAPFVAEPKNDDEILESETLSQSIIEDDAKDVILEYFEDWHELAEQEVPLEELFVTITEQLDEPIEADSEVKTVEENLLEPEAEVEFYKALEAESRPELYAIFADIKSVKKTVEKLYTARTKEECRYYIEQLTQDLTVILRGLGYDNPEKIIRDFLYTHSPESLSSLIKELEASLRHALLRDVRQRHSQHVHHRHIRLGKFVGFIMETLLPKRTVSTRGDYI